MKHSRLFFCLLLVFQSLAVIEVHAEKADSDKPIDIISHHVDVDNVKQVSTYSGEVVLTQGTLIMKGTKLVDVTSPDGWHFATLYAPPGGLATMRQKRDGGPDLWMEGEAADRITYDQKTQVATLYSKGKIRRLTGAKQTDESDGAYLSYNSQTEIVTGSNNTNGKSVPGGGFVHVTIEPHEHPEQKDK